MAPRASSFVGAADVGARRIWTPEEAAEFAARRDFRLVELLSKNRRALAAARQLGLFAARNIPRHEGTEHTSSAPQRRAAQTQTARSTTDAAALTSRQRRSRARAAAYFTRKREAEAMDSSDTTLPATHDLAQALAPQPAPDNVALERGLAEGASLLAGLRASAAPFYPAAEKEREGQRAATTPSPSLLLSFANAAACSGSAALPIYGPHPRPHGRW